MHVLLVTGEYPPMRGGVGAYTAALAQALVATGMDVSVVTSRRSASAAQSQPMTGVPLYPVIDRWDWRIWHQLPALAQQIGANWLHVQYQTAAFAMNPAINLAPGLWQRGRRLSVAWTYHDLLVPYLWPKAGARIRRWITLRPAQTSRLVVTTNEGDYQQLAALSSPVTVLKVPIGSNIAVHDLASAGREAARARRRYGPATLVIGYFGFLNRSKGGLTLVRTLHELVQQGHDAHLLMIGERVGASDPTNYAYLQEVETLIATLKLGARVQWTGHLDDAGVSVALHLVDLLFMPYNDGASLRRGTLMAGLAHGCAIVTTTPQSPLPELVDGRDLCFVPPEDPQAAAHTIAHLAATPALRQALGVSAREQSQQFTWSAIAAHHHQAYTTLNQQV